MRLLPKTIRGEFALFAVSLALPLFGLIGYGLYDRARDEFAAAQTLTRRLAESSTDRAAQYVADLRNTLEAVARRPLVRAMDRARCDPRLADLVDLYPRAGSIIVVDLEGEILCSSRPLPRDRVLRIVDEELLHEMRADPRFRISKPVMSRVSGRWIVSAVQPVFAEGTAAAIGTVAIATDLLQWRPFPTSEGLPKGAVITVVTSDGTIIARSADAQMWVSRKVWDERVMKRVLELKEGVIRAAGADGVDWIFGFAPVAELPWFVLAGLPAESVLAPARERLAKTGALLALVVGVVLALSWGFVARLSKPIRAIAEVVRARTEGNEDARVPVAGPVEVAGVARELNRMIEARSRAERELEDRVRERTAQLETANKELEAFSYSVSHDLRAPLRGIDGFSRLLQRDFAAALPPQAVHYLDRVYGNAQKMGQLIDDLLSFAKMARETIAFANVALESLVRECLDEFSDEIAARGVQVEVGKLPVCRADPALLKQVFLNLLGNALKYTQRQPHPAIEVGCRAANGEQIIYVKDNGVGFDMKHADRLFGVFQRLHLATDFEGTGIGLAVVQRIVLRHGGRVWAEAEPGKGATFLFTLAAAQGIRGVPEGGP